ncbi:RNA polymerase sigma-54 factor [Bradyrhizobium niftali]
MGPREGRLDRICRPSSHLHQNNTSDLLFARRQSAWISSRVDEQNAVSFSIGSRFMALTQRLELRHSQSLIMSPQLMQAIKLLQLGHLDLKAFVEEELERNPLLERASGNATGIESPTEVDQASAEPPAEAVACNAQVPAPTTYAEWGGRASGDEDYNLEAFVAAETTLLGNLAEQLSVAFTAPAQRMIGHYLIDLVDEAGYLPPDLGQAAERLGASQKDVEDVLAVLQKFDPPGVCARNLSECLAIQLRELDRYDPAMQTLVEHLNLLAKRDIAGLRKVCGVDDEDIADMIGEIRRLNPKPGMKFGAARLQTMVPDVYVRPGPDGGWHVELNSDTLPRVLVNQTYYSELSKKIGKDGDKSYFTDALQNATWLVRALDQRARTILKVATEIVRQQDGFFTHGMTHLRPLNLKAVANAIQMHESTVSRVTANKYMATNRGTFELKYFFTASIASADGGEAHSAEAVRHHIKQLIDSEEPAAILSDDTIVERLRASGIDIARRTVAKYREAMRIPSSLQRRRDNEWVTINSRASAGVRRP